MIVLCHTTHLHAATMVIFTIHTTLQQQLCPLDSGSSQGCLANHCLSCSNAPANCSVHSNNGTVICAGDTSTCSVEACNSCSNCVAYYYKSTNNLTAYRFTSGCISNDPAYTCDSSFPSCVRSGHVESESSLFTSNSISCSCYASNCTANLSFHYMIIPSQPTWATSTSTLYSTQTTIPSKFNVSNYKAIIH